MSAPEKESVAEKLLPKIPLEQREGAWLDMEGGEEDTTIGPAPIPRERIEYPGIWACKQKYSPEKRLQIANSSNRSAGIERVTAETSIELILDLDGKGQADVATGIGFFDHMLTLLAKHSLFDLTIEAQGDLHVDAHHTVEDVGICLGKALTKALFDKSGIRRYGSATLPMDETLATAAVDFSGRPFFVWNAAVPPEMLGTFNAPLAEEFWRAVSSSGTFNLHILCHYGRNAHHILEAIFKASARALRQAVEMDPRVTGVPSTKGVL